MNSVWWAYDSPIQMALALVSISPICLSTSWLALAFDLKEGTKDRATL